MKLYVDKQLNLDENKVNLLGEFCLFCANELPIEGEFTINLVGNKKDYGISTTAAYLVGENNCSVYGKNRAIADIMRSVAHEMTHT